MGDLGGPDPAGNEASVAVCCQFVQRASWMIGFILTASAAIDY